MDENSLCSSLIKWMETFSSQRALSIDKLTDGVSMATVLNQIAPEYFTDIWLSKIKPDVGGNWRLKVSNLRKVYQGVMDYYTEHLGLNMTNYAGPDLSKIGEQGDERELGRLLQLILGCAINCEQKQKHIEAIMGMEESVQAVIMNAIQDLMTREGSPGALEIGSPSDIPGFDFGPPASFHPQLKTLMEQLEMTTTTKDEMVQRCNELDHQISVLVEENNNLKGENEKLLERLDCLEAGSDIGGTAFKYKDLRKQVETLQDELFKMETSKEEYKAKADVLDKENQEVISKNEELQQLAEQARALKDEVDALRDMSERVAVYEGTVETYKKKIEELSDLKRQIKILEEKNTDYMQQNMELEEELKKSGTWRPQLDLYKKQVADLHQKLSDEAKKIDRQIFENKKVAEKLEALQQEKERILLERDALKESVEELRCHVSTLNSPDANSRPPSDLSDADMLEIIPPEIREKLARLQHENRVLKQKTLDSQGRDSGPVLQSMLNDLQERHDKLLQENRQMNQNIMELESQLEESKMHSRAALAHETLTLGRRATLGAALSADSTKRVLELERKLAELTDKNLSLEENLSKKENEMEIMEERYKKYLAKAKGVIRTLDPKNNPGLVPDVSALRTQLSEKEKAIENHEKESEKAKRIRDLEEKLISSAFYNLGMQMQRQMVTYRLANLDQNPSFLARQRQTSTRRVPMGHVPNSEFYEY